jgi:hypothetical protein
MPEQEIKKSDDQSPASLKILISIISLGVVLVILKLFEIV